jgi:signal transduction histidine kinase
MGRDITRLETIIEDLLRLTRFDQGQHSPHFQPTQLNEVVRQLVEDRSALAERQYVQLDMNLDAHLPEVIADPRLVEQVLSILLSNALNYTGPAGQVVVASSLCEANGKLWAEISVADNGPGVSSEDFPHIFDRFYRGKEALVSGVPGTGLGLALAKKIVQLHHGEISVDSRQEGGACFRVQLPVSQKARANALPDPPEKPG